jgi:hypothetical protein
MKDTKPDVSELSQDQINAVPQGKRSFNAASSKNSLLTGPKRANSPVNGRSMSASASVVTESAPVPYMDFPGTPPPGGDGGPGGAGTSSGPNITITAANYDAICQVGENELRKKRCEVNVDTKLIDETTVFPPQLDRESGIPIQDNRMTDAVQTSFVYTIAQQNRKLTIQTITEAIFPSTTTDTEPINGFKLLNTTKDIFGKLCPANVIRPQFLDMIVKAFKKIHDLTTPDRTPFITDIEYGWIDEILQGCLAGSSPANYFQDECREEVFAVDRSNAPLCLGYIMNDGRNRSTACYQTNLLFDPVMDVVWLMYEAVKARCFNNFQGNIRLFQRYGVAILDLYTRPMKYRWPLQTETIDFWERILGPGLDLALRNIDKCVHHIIEVSPFDFRTPRFMNINTVRLSNSNIKYLQ